MSMKNQEKMADREILQKAIEKVNKQYPFPLIDIDVALGQYDEDPSNSMKIIFSHGFAYAFWGEDNIKPSTNAPIAWEYYLQEMVLEENPIKYLEKFL